VENIRMDLGEVGWGVVDWIGLAQDRNRWRALVNVYNVLVYSTKGSIECHFTVCTTGLTPFKELNDYTSYTYS
jgi:hypothetical protein